MKKPYLLMILLFLSCRSTPLTECEILFSVNRSEFTDYTEPLLLYKEPGFQAIFENNKLLLNGKVLLHLENVIDYLELIVFRIDGVYYAYFYPQYDGQFSPYIETFKSGILVKLDESNPKLIRSLDYFEEFDICDSIRKILNK